ncbi:hypothetical protein J6590_044619 [Homalodisca vitripennis]|nr:hypothetical protein J6590_044619 [Homalodisca vitripennis]
MDDAEQSRPFKQHGYSATRGSSEVNLKPYYQEILEMRKVISDHYMARNSWDNYVS